MRFRLAAVSLSVLAVAAAVPASASAVATLAVDRACYHPGQQGTIIGAGYTPAATVSFTLNGSPFGSTTVDAAGNLLPSSFGAGTVPGKEQQLTLVGSDGVNTAQTIFTGTNTDVDVAPLTGNPGKKKRITARGFDQGRNLFAHVRGKKRKRNLKIGKLKGPCGKLKKKKRMFKASYPSGVYKVQFDQSRKYNKQAVPRVVFSVTIFRVFRPASIGSIATVGERWQRIK